MISIILKNTKWKPEPYISNNDVLTIDNRQISIFIGYCNTIEEAKKVISYLNLLLFTIMVYYKDENADYSVESFNKEDTFIYGSLYEYFDELNDYSISTVTTIDLLKNFPELVYLNKKIFDPDVLGESKYRTMQEIIPLRLYRLYFIELLESAAKNNINIQNIYRNIVVSFDNRFNILPEELNSLSLRKLRHYSMQYSSVDVQSVSDEEFLGSIGYNPEPMMADNIKIEYEDNEYIVKNIPNTNDTPAAIESPPPKEMSPVVPVKNDISDAMAIVNINPLTFLKNPQFIKNYISFCKRHSLDNLASTITRFFEKTRLDFFRIDDINEIKAI